MKSYEFKFLKDGIINSYFVVAKSVLHAYYKFSCENPNVKNISYMRTGA